MITKNEAKHMLNLIIINKDSGCHSGNKIDWDKMNYELTKKLKKIINQRVKDIKPKSLF